MEEERPLLSPRPTQKPLRGRLVFLGFALVTAAALAGFLHSRPVPEENQEERWEGIAEGSSVSFSTRNKYGDGIGHMYPWANVVEPLKETTFEVSGIGTTQPAPDVVWEIGGESLVGNPVVWSPPARATGTKSMRVSILSPFDGTVLHSQNSSVTVK